MSDADSAAFMATSEIWATSGVLLGLQVAATAYRISAETAFRKTASDAELEEIGAFLAPCELLNLGGMAICVLLVYVMPMVLQSTELVQVGFSVYALLYAAYPFALLGHNEMFSSFLSDEPELVATHARTCTEQERNVILLTTVAICAQLLGSLISFEEKGVVAGVAIVLCPAAICFYILVHRVADSGDGSGSPRRSRLRRRYRHLDGLDDEEEGFRYEVQIEFETDSREDVGLELREGRDGIEVADIRPNSLASKAPHCCPGMLLVRISSAVRPDRSARSLSVEDVETLLDEERPVTLTFEHPWQRELDKDNQYYYYNSFTDEAVWERPTELGAVLKAMRRWSSSPTTRTGRLSLSTTRTRRRSRSSSPVRGTRRVGRGAAAGGARVRAHSPRRDAYRRSPSRDRRSSSR